MISPSKIRWVAFWAAMGCLGVAALTWASSSRTSKEPVAPSPFALYVSRLLDVAKSAGEVGKTGHAFPAMEKLLGLPSDAGRMTAFEENRLFVYGEAKFPGKSTGSTWNRRVIFVKPSIFIVDDTGLSRGDRKPPAWQLYSSQPWSDRNGKARSEAGGSEVIVQTLYPKSVSRQMLPNVCKDCPQGLPSEPNLLGIVPLGDSQDNHLQHVLSVSSPGNPIEPPRTQLTESEGVLRLTITLGSRIFCWEHSSNGDRPGEIEITTTDGVKILGTRPLPSGVMPHSPEGVRLLETWDGDYRDGKHPKWDTGKPSADLVNAIEEGIFKPGRVVEFGSGTGTDSIYMASKGFDVTAIDISPSAVAQALAKARTAGVKVRFLLADALNPPEIGKFDYIYDRACYHEVRGQNLEAYLETLKKVSHPGTRLLLLAGNSNGPDLGFGPPTVSEEELRFDFTPLFDIEWLKESRFEVFPPDAGFPLAWSVLMKRKAD